MKKLLLLTFAGLTVFTIGCRSSAERGEIVKETFIHKYGVPVARSDWVLNGRDGQVIQLHKDGITTSRNYEKGILNGQTSYTFPNSSTIQKVESYIGGQIIAKTENFPSGLPMFEEKYEGDHLSQLTRWYEDGTPSAVETYSGNGNIDSGEYRTPLNTIDSRVQNGSGTRINRNNEAELVSKDSIQNGQLVERVTFFANGDPATVTPYENGLIHGTSLTFLTGGLPKTVEQWVHGQQEGTTIVYQNGEKVSEVTYVQGEKHGPEYRFRDGSQMVDEITWTNGVQHGQRKIYTDAGERTEWYQQGELVSRTTYERMNGIR